MRKIYALMVLLFAVLQLPAQVLVQGRPHPTAKPQMVSPRAIADGTFTMDMIENWSGEGANRAAFVVQWNAEGETSALVWGFRWDGEATGDDGTCNRRFRPSFCHHDRNGNRIWKYCIGFWVRC